MTVDGIIGLFFCIVPLGIGGIIGTITLILALFWAIDKSKSNQTKKEKFTLDDQTEIK